MRGWLNGKDYAFDVGATCCSRKSALPGAAGVSLSAAHGYHNHKLSAYARLRRADSDEARRKAATVTYAPLVFEDMGACTEDVRRFVLRLAALRAEKLDLNHAQSVAYAAAKVMAMLQKGNAIALAHHYCLPHNPTDLTAIQCE